jgi:flagellar basal body rod protein FlgB
MLDLLSASHKLTAHNLANAEVPGFRPLQAKFSDELRRAIESRDPEAIRNATIQVERSRRPGVDSEMEVARMSKNEMLFNTFAEIAAFRLRMLRTAVTSK